MNLLRQIRRLLSRDGDVASGTTPAPSKGQTVPIPSKPTHTGPENVEPQTIDDDDLTVPELPIISEDIRLTEDAVGFDPYDSAGKPERFD